MVFRNYPFRKCDQFVELAVRDEDENETTFRLLPLNQQVQVLFAEVFTLHQSNHLKPIEGKPFTLTIEDRDTVDAIGYMYNIIWEQTRRRQTRRKHRRH